MCCCGQSGGLSLAGFSLNCLFSAAQTGAIVYQTATNKPAPTVVVNKGGLLGSGNSSLLILGLVAVGAYFLLKK